MKENFSKRVQNIIKYGKEEAIRLGHSYVGSEHLLLGLLREGSGKSAKVFDIYDCDIDDIRAMVEDTVWRSLVDAVAAVSDFFILTSTAMTSSINGSLNCMPSSKTRSWTPPNLLNTTPRSPAPITEYELYKNRTTKIPTNTFT